MKKSLLLLALAATAVINVCACSTESSNSEANNDTSTELSSTNVSTDNGSGEEGTVKDEESTKKDIDIGMYCQEIAVRATKAESRENDEWSYIF